MPPFKQRSWARQATQRLHREHGPAGSPTPRRGETQGHQLHRGYLHFATFIHRLGYLHFATPASVPPCTHLQTLRSGSRLRMQKSQRYSGRLSYRDLARTSLCYQLYQPNIQTCTKPPVPVGWRRRTGGRVTTAANRCRLVAGCRLHCCHVHRPTCTSYRTHCSHPPRTTV